MKISIKKSLGHWKVNDKKLSECNLYEKKFFSLYIQDIKNDKKYCRIKKS